MSQSRLSVQLNTNDNREKKKQKNAFDLNATIHESEYTNKKPDLEPEHRFEVTLEADTFTEEKYILFDNYQRRVHNEGDSEISRRGFQRFLCSSPLHRHDTDSKKIGSFHQMYRLDGRLIAMGVLDLLPQAISGVYFIYHSDFEKWSFGKLSALREAALAVEGEYVYYYMGYYIHSCNKMRYKGDYKPYVLDFDTMQWNLLDDEMRRLMDKRAWVSLERERRIRDEMREIYEMNGDDVTDEEKDDMVAGTVYAVTLPDPVEATRTGLSVLELDVPGTMSLEQLQAEVDLDKMKVAISRGTLHEAEDLISWDTGSETDMESLKGVFAEFAACVGPEVAREIVVDLSRGAAGG
jgi:arginine-tRNA-protein transferase